MPANRLLIAATLILVSVVANAEPEIVTFRAVEMNEPIVNPYMGWGIWAGRDNVIGAGEYGNPVTLEANTVAFGDDAALFSWLLVDWRWSRIEPREGQFDWSEFDKVIDYWAKRNKQVLLRFWVTDDPGWNGAPGGIPCPDWVWEKGVKYREYVGNGGVKRREPDYNDPSYVKIYLPALRNLLTEFAAKYDRLGSPIILTQVMGYGHWADYATWYSKYQFPSVERKREVLSQLMNLYVGLFRHIRLIQFGGPDWDSNSYRTLDDFYHSKAMDLAVRNGFGLIWTGFIDGLSGKFDRTAMERYWRTNPIIAEGNWAYGDMLRQHTHGTFDENLDGAIDWHANYSHFYWDAPQYKLVMKTGRATLERGLRPGGLGYRLVPENIAFPKELPAGYILQLRQKWVNRSVGRLYVRCPLKLYLTDEQGNEKFSRVNQAFDESNWVQGEEYSILSHFQLDKKIAPGDYDVRIALVDADTGDPTIRLPIEGGDSHLRYRLGQVKILNPDMPAGCVEGFCK
jgi:Domain of unknown function (DUF4832)/Beta-galactosidase